MAAPSTPVFTDQTLRQIVHASAGGSTVRVRLSNAYGDDALFVGAAHVAVRARGPRLVAGTDRVLAFAGRASVSIPRGAVALSDPVELDVPALGDLAVSIYVPRATAGATVHSLGSDTNYILDGDRAGAEDPAISSTTLAVYFLTGVEVLASPGARLIVCLGDSLTDGVGSTPDAHHTWPDLLAARLIGERDGKTFAVVNQGYSGNRLLRDRCGASALARFDRDVIAQSGVTDVIVFGGINDIGVPTLDGMEERVTAEQIIAAYRELIARAQAARLRIHGATLTPFKGSDVYTPDGEATRQAVNAFIRRGGEFDAVFEFDAAVRDDADTPHLRPRYDSGDHIHLNDTGYEALANAIDVHSLSA